jgi:hypothetical protein
MFIAALLISCEVDNYSGPDGALTGRVIDVITGNPVITEQPNGFRVRYDEISWSDTPVAQYIWGKADGTFANIKMFAGTYEVTPVEGAFVTPQKQTVTISSGKTASVDFTVTPYVSFSNVSIVKNGATTVKAAFTLTKNVASSQIQCYQVFATSKTPYVGVTYFENQLSTGEVAITEDDLNKPIEVTLDNYVAGKTYYIRVGARCVNSSNRYNMTEVVKIQM